MNSTNSAVRKTRSGPLKNWLAAQSPQPATLAQLQALLDTFTHIYNHQRPHRSLPHRATPATAYTARPKATPGDRDTDHRVRTDRLDTNGNVTLRHGGKLYHIGTGRTYARTHVLLLVQDLHIRIINAATGELTLDTTRNYQPTGRPPGPPPRTPRKQNPEP
jgi:D-alanyl-D-alanine carboxypeptidase